MPKKAKKRTAGGAGVNLSKYKASLPATGATTLKQKIRGKLTSAKRSVGRKSEAL